ncbi:hypothetical protein PsYK624_078210 [Phanerochaete sordida]|uniref:Uncharacterized protein n=1 Tax=Phanerochaete sordida TaxID=48140 RepID=A0A9P3GB69_9APHY|nr:hypothetical protein PsYK624_078210 [Phanerochaete sordida]
MPVKTKKGASTSAMWNNPEMAPAAAIDREAPRLTIPYHETVVERMNWAYKSRNISPKAFELTIVGKDPKPKRRCPVCRQNCNGDDKTVGRHIRTKGHITNLADCLWMEFDSFLGDDIVVPCDKCGEKIWGARTDSLYRHQIGPCPNKMPSEEEPPRPPHQRRSKAPAAPQAEPAPAASAAPQAGPATKAPVAPQAGPAPKVERPPTPSLQWLRDLSRSSRAPPSIESEDDEDEQPPRKVARRSFKTEVADERHRERTQSEDSSSPSLPPLTPTTEAQTSSEEEEAAELTESPEPAPAPLPERPRTPTRATRLSTRPGPSTLSRIRTMYGSARVDSVSESPSTSRRSSVSSGRSSEAEHDVPSSAGRVYAPRDAASTEDEGPLRMLATVAEMSPRVARVPSSPYDPETYQANWGPELPVSPLYKRGLREHPAPKVMSWMLPGAPLASSPSQYRSARTPSPPPSGHFW